MQKGAISLTTLALIVASLSISCGGAGNSAARNALKSLRKVDAATEVGVTYQQYSQLVIDAKAEVNEAIAKLPNGELKKELNLAMELYSSIRELWDESIQSKARKGISTDAESEALMQQGWRLARTHLDRASKLLDE